MLFEYCRNEQIFEYYTIRFSPNFYMHLQFKMTVVVNGQVVFSSFSDCLVILY